MNYALKVIDGNVEFIVVIGDSNVLTRTSEFIANRMIRKHGARSSTRFEGYPIHVRTDSGAEYYFAGSFEEAQKDGENRKEAQKSRRKGRADSETGGDA